jgi:hypothetical protein
MKNTNLKHNGLIAPGLIEARWTKTFHGDEVIEGGGLQRSPRSPDLSALDLFIYLFSLRFR